MSETFQGTFAPEEPRTKSTEVSRPDTGRCCICGTERPPGFRYLCETCASTTVARVLTDPVQEVR